MDVVLRGGTVVDGTRAAARRADVLLSDGRIMQIGAIGRAAGAPSVDLSGLVLAPGFIDPHTHYDAQVFWDPDLTPSSWHGVTTAVMGNCGFSIAPTRPEHRDVMLRTLERVEGMPLQALESGLPWGFETFPQYLDMLESLPKRINLAALVGHTPLRYYVLGPDATERPASGAETQEMCALVEQALNAGAIGFSTSKSPTHIGAYNLPVPSRAAALEEVYALADVLGARQAGVVQATWGPELFAPEFAEIARRTGRPVTWAAIMAERGEPGRAADVAARTAELGTGVFPQIACRPVVLQLLLANPTTLARMLTFKEVLERPAEDRAALYADRGWRSRAHAELAADPLWSGRLETAVVEETGIHHELVGGPTLAELGGRDGRSAFDVMLDLALADGLRTRFRILLTNDDEDQVAALLRDDHLLLGLSDAGAHTSQLCDAGAPTHLLGYWCRKRGVLSLEDAVWRLTGHPAEVFELEDRGTIQVGGVADLVAFDMETVGSMPIERVHDFPGGTDRLISRSVGIEYTWVGGHLARQGSQDIEGSHHGRLLRHGR